MADELIKKIRTDKGDLQIDYNALANKPTISSLGGVSKTGDTMTGNLVINNESTSPALGLQAPNNEQGQQAYARVYKNASSTADYGLQLRDYTHGGNETENSSMLTICSNKSALADKIQFTNQENGVSTNYRLYGEHNKPTLSALGVTATTTELNKLKGLTATTSELNILDGLTATTAELNYCDGVTSNIQTQLNGKAASSHNHSADDIASGTLPIANGGTGATTVAGIRENLGNLGKVYRQNPTDKSIAAGETPVTLASLTLPAGNYIVTGNHVWLQHTAGSIYDASIRHSDPNKSIYCYCRNLMDNGGGMACSAIVQLTEETTIVYQTRHSHSANATAHDVHFYAIKIT